MSLLWATLAFICTFYVIPLYKMQLQHQRTLNSSSRWVWDRSLDRGHCLLPAICTSSLPCIEVKVLASDTVEISPAPVITVGVLV